MGGAAVSRKLLAAVKQFEVECGVLMARSQAKQLTKGFGGAQAVMLDFSGVTMIGQAFADEVFRPAPPDRASSRCRRRLDTVYINTHTHSYALQLRSRQACGQPQEARP